MSLTASLVATVAAGFFATALAAGFTGALAAGLVATLEEVVLEVLVAFVANGFFVLEAGLADSFFAGMLSVCSL